MLKEKKILPLVTIGILSFNRLEDLKESLSKLKDITYPNLEFLIVDNGSTDGSKEYIKNFNDIKIKYCLLDKNYGVGLGRLKILKESKGDYIFSIDEDCYLKFDVIDIAISIFQKNDNLGAIGLSNINPNIFKDKKIYNTKTYLSEDYSNTKERYEGALSLCSSAWKKEALNKININNIDIQQLYLYKKIKHNNEFKKIHLSTEIEADLSYLLCSYGFNSLIIPDLIAFHKISPSNRNQKFLILDGLLRCFRVAINFSPPKKVLKELFLLIYKCINMFLLTRNFIYLNSIFITLFTKSNNILKYRKINNSNYSKLRKINIEPIIGINSNLYK